MSAPFLDAHTHVQFSGFDDDREGIIKRAKDAGVAMINVGTQKDTSRMAVELAHNYDGGMYAAVGLHPVHTSASYHDAKELGGGAAAKAFTSRGEVFDAEYYRPLAEDPKTLAIGECGLDYYHFNEAESREAQIKKQKEAFLAQIALSREVKKPLMIHCRNAFGDLIELLKDNNDSLNSEPGVIHFFTGSEGDATQLLELGFSFTFGGVVTFARDYDGAIKSIPLKNIISETDAPYVAPVPYRGKRNEPSYVIETVKKLAELKGVSAEKMKEAIWQNARRIFGPALH